MGKNENKEKIYWVSENIDKFVGKIIRSGKGFGQGKVSPGKIFIGENFRHQTKISSLFPNEVFPVRYATALKHILGEILKNWFPDISII